MEEQLRNYYNRLIHITDIYERAAAMKELLVSDLENLTCNEAPFNSLDDALNVFFTRKECSYAIELLDWFIARGNQVEPCDGGRNTHYSGKFVRIRDVICELFVEKAANIETSHNRVVNHE